MLEYAPKELNIICIGTAISSFFSLLKSTAQSLDFLTQGMGASTTSYEKLLFFSDLPLKDTLVMKDKQ